MRLILVLIIVLCLLVVGIAAFIWSGFYNIAANVPHWDSTHWFLSIVRDQSISAHSRGIVVPPPTDPKLSDIGFRNYHAMCRLCHNAPGYPRTEIAKGLYPAPPDFASKTMIMRSDRQVYWIVRNGIKMTGMPSFGATHSKDELWAVVRFAKNVQHLKPEEYEAMEKTAGPLKDLEHHH